MSSVGETLRRERLRKELTLERISQATKISTRLLEALENNQYDHLPGDVFAKSFARQYARYLGLDQEEIAAEVGRAMHPAADLPRFAAAEPEYKVPRVMEWDGFSQSSSSVVPAAAGVVIVMLLCAGVYAWWMRSRDHNAAPAAAAHVTHKQTSRTVTPASEVTQPAAPSAPLHVSLAADSDVWVHVWADNKSLYEGVLQPGDGKAIDAADAIRIRTGNAGDLHVIVNGKPAGEIGPKGQIRIVEVTMQGIQIMPPPPKPAAPAPEPL